MLMSATPRYWAFLSYSHRDKGWADWLHGAIESYRVPKALVGIETGAGPIPQRLSPIFRDRDELPASADLGAEIRGALANARFLIVLCSPAAAASRWTNEEIAAFKRLHPDGQVLAAIVAGEPFASEMPGREAEECFPPALRCRFDADGRPTGEKAEPIAADLRDQGDGKRLGKLKLVAGMLGVGLDQLARREGQRRQKRLAILAAASLAGMVVTSGLAVMAVDARDEAEDQRADAEALVGFMLGDLRSKLEPLGRLDVLDSVGAKALDYYRRQDRGSLTEESLAQQARALTLIGEIANRRGDLDGALKRFREARASTAEAVNRAPNDEQRIFDHAQNVFWVGYIAWQRGQTGEAEAAFKDYKRLAERLVALNGGKPEWRLESVYADTNLGTLLLEQRQFTRAARIFDAAVRDSEQLAAGAPGDAQYQLQLVESLAYMADAQENSGQLEEAMRSRERQLELLARLGSSDGDNAKIRRKTVAAHRALGRLFTARGDLETGLRHLQAAAAAADQLLRTEPDNTEWLQIAAATNIDLGELLLVAAKEERSGAASRLGCDIARRLVRRDPTVVAWRTEVLHSCLLLRAKLAGKRGAASEALAVIGEALALGSASQSGNRPVAGYATAGAQMLAGDQYSATGRPQSARAAWQKALAALPTHGQEAPAEQALRFLLLRKLGRIEEAQKLGAGLDALGYRHPAYVRSRLTAGASPV
ncbi:MAG TPA: toll/interleukin-1 receptor domain-containing protein [Allosphingosinicella sp.]|nr:toll/interleukin-1 receptor domain-containing protein [Allosphingosinicella sp.]